MNRLKSMLKMIWKKGAIHIFTGSFLNKFVVFFGSIVIVRLLSKTEYGMLGYAENLYSFAYILAGLGISNAIMRYVVLADTMAVSYTHLDVYKRQAVLCKGIMADC